MDLSLFPENLDQEVEESAPLAWRLRPLTLAEFLGQEKILSKGSVLREAIENDSLSSLIFWGPPGSGKTTLAKIISNITKFHFTELSAVTSNVGNVRNVLQQAKERLGIENRGTILLIDEIHRFNKAQQDALLPSVEEGLVILIGVTTENPYFEVNSPLISRSRIFVFEPLLVKNIEKILKRAVFDKERGLGGSDIELNQGALRYIAEMAEGDARQALNALEMAAKTTKPGKNGIKEITVDIAQDAMQKKMLIYDRNGDAHYNIVSAFIKSIRGSDPDAALYWLTRMISGGEDPKFIARRMIIAASEDIGLADSRALEVALAAAKAVEFVGLPEARINLAHAVIYLATAPKSNSVIKAVDSALGAIKSKRNDGVPVHLRDSNYSGAKKLGHGRGYKYPHDFEGGYVAQDYLPDNIKGEKFYNPSLSGDERKILEYMKSVRVNREKSTE